MKSILIKSSDIYSLSENLEKVLNIASLLSRYGRMSLYGGELEYLFDESKNKYTLSPTVNNHFIEVIKKEEKSIVLKFLVRKGTAHGDDFLKAIPVAIKAVLGSQAEILE